MKSVSLPWLGAALAAALTLSFSSSSAQGSGGSHFPVAYGATNIGMDYWLSFPANWDYAAPFKYVRLYITSGTATQVRVWAGSVLRKTLSTVPYDVVTFDLDPLSAQCFVKDDRTPAPLDQIYAGKAVHIESDAPIVVYGMNRVTFTSDGLLALPVNALGNEYVVASSRDVADGVIQNLPSQYMVISPYDGTDVTIVNPWDTPNHKAGEVVHLAMQRGDVYSAMSVGFGGDLTGAIITASKPIAVTAGQNCTYLPTFQYAGCDHLCEELLPVSSWGKIYHSMPFAERNKADLYRILAGADSTHIYANGTKLVTLSKKGGAEGTGWYEYLPPTRGPIEFSSDQPISVFQYNNSEQYDNVATDPFYLCLTPLEQFQTEIVFTTPSNDYPLNFVNIVSDSATLFSMEIDSAGLNAWKNVVSLYSNSYQRFPTQVNGMTFVGKTIPIAPGTYHIRASGKFAGYIYGHSAYDSYGYPLALATGNLTKADRDAPQFSRTEAADGSVVGAVSDYPEDPAVRTNLAQVVLDPINSVNYTLAVAPFEALVSRTANYTLKVIDSSKNATAILVSADGGAPANITQDTVNYYAAVWTGVSPDRPATVERPIHILTVTPNPAGESIVIHFDVPFASDISTLQIGVFDQLGKRVQSLSDPRHIAGERTLKLNVSALPPGAYFVRIVNAAQREVAAGQFTVER